eukprot:Rhum_TRINITY_DN5427_c0_g2::Rhum_TRINITY_DN5427_c0_g2_i1::g.17413::m.17413
MTLRRSIGAAAAGMLLACVAVVGPCAALRVVRDEQAIAELNDAQLQALGVARDTEEHAAWASVCGEGAATSDVVMENCHVGEHERVWGINAAGHASIQGFATQQSYRPGEQVEFKVKTDSTNYTIDVYRVGYYGGRGARKIGRTVKVTTGLAQPECAVEADTLLVDCGNWGVSATWTIPPIAVSGVYFARLTRLDPPPFWRHDASQAKPSSKFANPQWDYAQPPPCGAAATAEEEEAAGGGRARRPQAGCDASSHAYGAAKQRAAGRVGVGELEAPVASHVYFVVRRREGVEAKVLFQTSDTTWHAYNTYGAPNTYGAHAVEQHWEHFPKVVQDMRDDGRLANRRSYKRSYNVPMLTRDTRSVNMLFGVEYSMIRFLERYGYDVGYQSGADTAKAAGTDLRFASVFLSVGHDEYWAPQQRQNVENARDRRRTHLIFLSGNEAYWRVRWEDGHRTMAIYKETQASEKLDVTAAGLKDWTGTWRDAAPQNPVGSMPENALTGTIWTVNAWRQDALQLPHRYARLRFWRHTEAQRSTRPHQKAVLMKALLGHEWDEDLDNGFRPSHAIRLSETTVENVQHIYDGGATFDTAAATHHLVLYKVRSGAIVFGTGTVQWPWGLDAHHDSLGMPNNVENEYDTRIAEDPHSPDPTIVQATLNILKDMGATPAAGLLPGQYTVDVSEAVDRVPPSCRVEGVTFTCDGGSCVLRSARGVASDVGGAVAGIELCARETADGGRESCVVVNGGVGNGLSAEWEYRPETSPVYGRIVGLMRQLAAGEAVGAAEEVAFSCYATDDSLNTSEEDDAPLLHKPGSDECAA